MSVLLAADKSDLIQKLQQDVARQEQTISELKANGHPCPDAGRHLQRLKEELALLKRDTLTAISERGRQAKRDRARA